MLALRIHLDGTLLLSTRARALRLDDGDYAGVTFQAGGVCPETPVAHLLAGRPGVTPGELVVELGEPKTYPLMRDDEGRLRLVEDGCPLDSLEIADLFSRRQLAALARAV